MNANREPMHDGSDAALDRMIRAATAQPSPLDIKDRVIERATAFTPGSRARRWPATVRPWFLAASATVTVAAVCVIALLVMPSSSIGWGDVTKAVKSQQWIRATTTWDGRQSTTWLSPERQVWAFRKDNDWFIFMDGRQQAKYEYRTSQKQVAKMAMREEDKRLVSPTDYLSQGPWLFGTEKVVSQTRREVKEAGKKWIEFDLVFWRGDMSLGTLRVDPETRLPVYLLLRSRTDGTKSVRSDFTYPAEGPTDIYALGVPADKRIDDRMPSQEAMRVLDAVTASRARIGDFRLIATATSGRGLLIPHSLIVWRKGDRWRIDWCEPEAQPGAAVKPPDGLGWGDPSIEKLKLSWLGPLYLCDGQKVYENTSLSEAISRRRFEDPQPPKPVAWRAVKIAPQDLLSGNNMTGALGGRARNARFASLLYPDLSPLPGCGFEFDSRLGAVPGCVLIKRSASIAAEKPEVGHEWYYLDPTKGYAVVQVELFNLPTNAVVDPKSNKERQTIHLEDFKKSPQGFWYAGVIRDTSRRSTAHYHFDFGAALPDGLFAVDDTSKSRKQ